MWERAEDDDSGKAVAGGARPGSACAAVAAALLIWGTTAAAPGPVRAQGDAVARDTVPGPRPSLFDGGPSRVATTAGFAVEERPPLRPVSRTDAVGAPFLAAASELGPRGRVLGRTATGGRRLRAWHARVGDRARVRLSGIRASGGDVLHAVRIGRATGRGTRVVQPRALLRVERVSDGEAVATVTDVFGIVRPGDRVVRIPLPPAPDGVEFRGAEREIEARLIGIEGDAVLLRDGTVAFLGAGASDGVRPGDVFAAEGTEAEGDDVRLIVVRVRGRTSTARVMDAGDGSVSVGDRTRLARRLAGSGR